MTVSTSAAGARPRDELVRTISEAGGIAVRAMVGTELVAEASARHHTSPAASAALGRTLMGAVLLATSTKSGETVQLQLRGDGPLGSITAISDGEGRVRGYASNPGAVVPPDDGRLDVGAAVGRGVLAVVRYGPRSREPYRGIVPLVAGTVAQDIAHYLAESEQIPSAVALGVFLTGDGGIDAAGGFFVQALPNAREDEVEQVEANVRGFPGPGELVREGVGADGIVDRLLTGLGSRERRRSRPAFHCACGRERVLRAVSLLGEEEIRSSAEGGENLEIRCEFCGERYDVTPDDLGALL